VGRYRSHHAPEQSRDQRLPRHLKKVYDGAITNWSSLGGPDAKIVLVTREGTTSGVGYLFRLMAFNDGAYEFKARSLKVKDTGPLEDKIEATPSSARFADDVNRSSQEVVALSDRVVGEVESIRQTVKCSTETAMKMNRFVAKLSATSQRMKESLALFRL